MNGSRHLLRLVNQMEKGCTVQSEQSRVTNEGDISADRQVEGLMDNRRTRRQRGTETEMLNELGKNSVSSLFDQD